MQRRSAKNNFFVLEKIISVAVWHAGVAPFLSIDSMLIFHYDRCSNLREKCLVKNLVTGFLVLGRGVTDVPVFCLF